ncbi:hypothetical protein ACFSJ3_00345 [Corallincola platygyrae]|uniref:Uncharacterized protein n=1 Tax=Corallincola platygyrae TaxID=1193278 RepID=A0ABW4XI13_9GAMM
METEAKPFKERRKGPDIWARMVGWLSLAGWLTFIAVLVMVQYARPEMNTGLVRYHGIEVREEWLPRLSDMIFISLWFCCGLSLFSMMFNRKRMRRKTDTNLFNLILLGLLSVVGVLLMFPVVTSVS